MNEQPQRPMIRFEGMPEELVELRRGWARLQRAAQEYEGRRQSQMCAQILGIAHHEAPPCAAEQQILQQLRTDCPVVVLLESFCEDIRAMRDAGQPVEVLSAPECGSDNLWRAEILHRGRRRRLWWNADVGIWPFEEA